MLYYLEQWVRLVRDLFAQDILPQWALSFRTILVSPIASIPKSMGDTYQLLHTTLTKTHRHPRPHIPLGPASRPLPTPPTIRQRAPHPHPARHRLSPAGLPPRRPRLGDSPGELRRRIRRTRRAIARFSALGSCD